MWEDEGHAVVIFNGLHTQMILDSKRFESLNRTSRSS